MHVNDPGFAEWNRAVAYGDGVFESILVVGGVAPLWHLHKLRLQLSLARLCIFCDHAELEKQFLAALQQHPDGIIKLIVARSGGDRGYSARNSSSSVIRIICYPLPTYSCSRMREGVRLHICQQRLSHNPALAGIKHLNRLEQVFAASERNPVMADEGLMLDQTGAVIECTSSNIFIYRNEVLQTPRLDNCGVAGVMRSYIIEQMAAKIPSSVQQTRLILADVLAADTVFICNSVFGVMPVVSIGVSALSVRPELIEKFWQELSLLGYASLYA